MQLQAPGPQPPADFTAFMRNYQDMVFSTSLRLVGNAAQAEDISQEVFLLAHERWAELSLSATAGGWLRTVATNMSLNHLQRYRRRWRFFSELPPGEGGQEVEFAAADVFFEGMDQSERRALVERTLSDLPDHQRVPLVLYHFEEESYASIAVRLGVSLAKVKTDIFRARAALAAALMRSRRGRETLNR